MSSHVARVRELKQAGQSVSFEPRTRVEYRRPTTKASMASGELDRLVPRSKNQYKAPTLPNGEIKPQRRRNPDNILIEDNQVWAEEYGALPRLRSQNKTHKVKSIPDIVEENARRRAQETEMGTRQPIADWLIELENSFLPQPREVVPPVQVVKEKNRSYSNRSNSSYSHSVSSSSVSKSSGAWSEPDPFEWDNRRRVQFAPSPRPPPRSMSSVHSSELSPDSIEDGTHGQGGIVRRLLRRASSLKISPTF